MFEQVKAQVQQRFADLSVASHLFQVEIDRDKIWEIYLDGFDPLVRQGYNCNCCKSFMRQYGGIVTIENNKIKSIWDISIPDNECENSIKAVLAYIKSFPISNVFKSPFGGLGTDKNTQLTETGSITWNHFFLRLPAKFIHRGSASVESAYGEWRDNKNVLQRSLDTIPIDVTETVLELVAQNSLYRGKESEGILTEFLKVQKQYKELPANEKANFCWVQAVTQSGAFCRIRNSAIGTLLVDLAEGKDLDSAVGSFERVVAPANYKRPVALVTPKMIAEAQARLTELGMLNSLERRFAEPVDLDVNNVLFMDRSSTLTDVFAELKQDALVNPRTLSKVEEIGIEDFLTNVLPTCKMVEVLVENSHLVNLVSVLTAKHESPNMFKWDNPFSLSYTGGVADSMKERVKEAGGKIDGVLRFTIQWNEDGKSIVDFDAHGIEPNGHKLYYGNRSHPSSMSGQLDVDMIRPKKVGIENIVWTNKSKMAYGDYQFLIHNYDSRRNTGFQAQVEFDGQVFEFAQNKHATGITNIATVTYSKDGFSIKSNLSSTDGVGTVVSKEKWGLKTNQFHKVRSIFLSPNYWGTKTGNKHYVFTLNGCKADEPVRPFFNEYLTEPLQKERKVFELLGSKLKVEDSPNQLSGVGFSDTQRNQVIVRVTGASTRNLKIKI